MKPRRNKSKPKPEWLPFKGRASRRDTDYEQLAEGAPACFKAFHVEETKLAFANDQISVDSKEGLTLFGPANANGNSQRSIRVAAIGTGQGIDTLKAYLETARQKITPGLNSKGKLYDPYLLP